MYIGAEHEFSGDALLVCLNPNEIQFEPGADVYDMHMYNDTISDTRVTFSGQRTGRDDYMVDYCIEKGVPVYIVTKKEGKGGSWANYWKVHARAKDLRRIQSRVDGSRGRFTCNKVVSQAQDIPVRSKDALAKLFGCTRITSHTTSFVVISKDPDTAIARDMAKAKAG